jgi:hypothetical protein
MDHGLITGVMSARNAAYSGFSKPLGFCFRASQISSSPVRSA